MPKKRKQQYEEDIPSSNSSSKKSKSNNPLNMSGFGKSKKDAMQQHKDLIYSYLRYYGGSLDDLMPDKSTYKTDLDVVYENNKFIWDEEVEDNERSWNERVAKKYWDQLNKEYVIADLSRYKNKQYAFRWRTEKEVINGYGQFTCANKACKDHIINDLDGLASFEVMFNYKEQGEKKSALVKVRLCEKCEKKLNYHWQHKQVKKRNKHKKEESTKAEVLNKLKKEEKHGDDDDDVIFIKKEKIKKESIIIDSDSDDTTSENERTRRRSKSSTSNDRDYARSRTRSGDRASDDPNDRRRHRSNEQSDKSNSDWRFDRDSRDNYRSRDRNRTSSSSSKKTRDPYAEMKNIWKEDSSKEKTVEEKRDEQFDEYLNDLLL